MKIIRNNTFAELGECIEELTQLLDSSDTPAIRLLAHGLSQKWAQVLTEESAEDVKTMSRNNRRLRYEAFDYFQ